MRQQNKSPLMLAGLIFILSWLIVACNSNLIPTTAKERDYAEWYEEFSDKIYATNDKFIEALKNVEANPSDSNQGLILIREIARYTMLYDEAVEKNPPSSLNEVHTTLLEGLREYNIASDILTGVSDEDPSNIPTHMAQGGELLLETQKLYHQWKEQREF